MVQSLLLPKQQQNRSWTFRQTLRYLGAPITTKSFLFGDNRYVVTSATLLHSTLRKRHNILAFHRLREAIAAKLMAFYWIQSAHNLSDMLSKTLGPSYCVPNDTQIIDY